MSFDPDSLRDEAPVPLTTVPYIAPYPKEYRELKPNLSVLSRLAEDTGGEMVDPEKFNDALKRFYTPAQGKGRQGQETWWPLAGIALLVFLSDLVLRQWRDRALAGREPASVGGRSFSA